jgi:hypothetical protein
MQPNAPESPPRFDFRDTAHPAPSPGEAFASAGRHLGEIKAYAGHYVAAKLDGVKSSLKSVVLYAVLGVLGAIAGTAILATAGVLLVRGLAEGLTVLFDGRMWIANMVTGLVILLGTCGAAYFVIAKALGKSRAATAAKYEAMNRDQKTQFGHNVHERAKEAQFGKAV